MDLAARNALRAEEAMKSGSVQRSGLTHEEGFPLVRDDLYEFMPLPPLKDIESKVLDANIRFRDGELQKLFNVPLNYMQYATFMYQRNRQVVNHEAGSASDNPMSYASMINKMTEGVFARNQLFKPQPGAGQVLINQVDAWDGVIEKSGQFYQKNFIHCTFFPAILKRAGKVIVRPYASCYASFEPTSKSVTHQLKWKPYRLLHGHTVNVDVTLIGNLDCEKSIISALNLAQPADGSFVWIMPADNATATSGKDQFVLRSGGGNANELKINGASLGLSMVATILHMAPIAYTGFVRHMYPDQRYDDDFNDHQQREMKIGTPINKYTAALLGKYGRQAQGTPTSYGINLPGPMGQLRQNRLLTPGIGSTRVARSTDIVEEVDGLQYKCAWAIFTQTPLVMPHKTVFDQPLQYVLDSARFRASHAVLALAPNAYSMVQAEEGIPYAAVASPLLIAVTVSEAAILGAYAWIHFGLRGKITNVGALRGSHAHVPKMIHRSMRHAQKRSRSKNAARRRSAASRVSGGGQSSRPPSRASSVASSNRTVSLPPAPAGRRPSPPRSVGTGTMPRGKKPRSSITGVAAPAHATYASLPQKERDRLILGKNGKKPKSGYQLYSNFLRNNAKRLGQPGPSVAEVGRKWTALSDQRKKNYSEYAAGDTESIGTMSAAGSYSTSRRTTGSYRSRSSRRSRRSVSSRRSSLFSAATSRHHSKTKKPAGALRTKRGSAKNFRAARGLKKRRAGRKGRKAPKLTAKALRSRSRSASASRHRSVSQASSASASAWFRNAKTKRFVKGKSMDQARSGVETVKVKRHAGRFSSPYVKGSLARSRSGSKSSRRSGSRASSRSSNASAAGGVGHRRLRSKSKRSSRGRSVSSHVSHRSASRGRSASKSGGRPLSGYNLFVAKTREAGKKAGKDLSFQQMGAMWTALPQTKKDAYNAAAKGSRPADQKALLSHMSSASKRRRSRSRSSKARSSKRGSNASAASKRSSSRGSKRSGSKGPRSGYQLFAKQMLQEGKRKNRIVPFVEIGKKWKSMSAAQKGKYNAAVKASKKMRGFSAASSKRSHSSKGSKKGGGRRRRSVSVAVPVEPKKGMSRLKKLGLTALGLAGLGGLGYVGNKYGAFEKLKKAELPAFMQRRGSGSVPAEITTEAIILPSAPVTPRHSPVSAHTRGATAANEPISKRTRSATSARGRPTSAGRFSKSRSRSRSGSSRRSSRGGKFSAASSKSKRSGASAIRRAPSKSPARSTSRGRSSAPRERYNLSDLQNTFRAPSSMVKTRGGINSGQTRSLWDRYGKKALAVGALGAALGGGGYAAHRYLGDSSPLSRRGSMSEVPHSHVMTENV